MNQTAQRLRSEPVHEVDEFVTDQHRVDTEEESQDQSRAQPIEEFGLCKENQRQNAKSGERHLANRKTQRAMADHGRHHRIDFDCATIEQLKRKEGIEATH